MTTRLISSFAFIVFAVLGVIRPASAQWVVIDPTALTQLLIQVQQSGQQIAIAAKELAQAQQAYNSTTGNRGMQNLQSGQNRNYLPTNWTQLSGVLSGSGTGTYGALGSDVTSTVNRNAVLTSAQISQLSSSELDSLKQRRQSVALLEALSRAALTNNSGRFTSMQGLINAIPTATDQKGALDLHTRVTAEQGMLTAEKNKLDTLYKAAQVASETERERADEKAIADIGRLNKLPPMGLGSN
jgi:type IV secretion system protein VirB5